MSLAAMPHGAPHVRVKLPPVTGTVPIGNHAVPEPTESSTEPSGAGPGSTPR